jgi:hypothetical protein
MSHGIILQVDPDSSDDENIGGSYAGIFDQDDRKNKDEPEENEIRGKRGRDRGGSESSGRADDSDPLARNPIPEYTLNTASGTAPWMHDSTSYASLSSFLPFLTDTIDPFGAEPTIRIATVEPIPFESFSHLFKTGHLPEDISTATTALVSCNKRASEHLASVLNMARIAGERKSNGMLTEIRDLICKHQDDMEHEKDRIRKISVVASSIMGPYVQRHIWIKGDLDKAIKSTEKLTDTRCSKIKNQIDEETLKNMEMVSELINKWVHFAEVFNVTMNHIRPHVNDEKLNVFATIFEEALQDAAKADTMNEKLEIVHLIMRAIHSSWSMLQKMVTTMRMQTSTTIEESMKLILKLKEAYKNIETGIQNKVSEIQRLESKLIEMQKVVSTQAFIEIGDIELSIQKANGILTQLRQKLSGIQDQIRVEEVNSKMFAIKDQVRTLAEHMREMKELFYQTKKWEQIMEERSNKLTLLLKLQHECSHHHLNAIQKQAVRKSDHATDTVLEQLRQVFDNVQVYRPVEVTPSTHMDGMLQPALISLSEANSEKLNRLMRLLQLTILDQRKSNLVAPSA